MTHTHDGFVDTALSIRVKNAYTSEVFLKWKSSARNRFNLFCTCPGRNGFASWRDKESVYVSAEPSSVRKGRTASEMGVKNDSDCDVDSDWLLMCQNRQSSFPHGLFDQ